MAEVTSKLETIIIPEEGNTLYKSFEMIGQVTGISFKYPTLYPKTPQEVCFTSGIRYRQVSLKSKWWKENKGPLLVFSKDDQQPLVVIYTLDKTYELFDPISKHHIPIKKEIIRKLIPIAYTFYVPLPEGSFNFSKLLSWGLRGQTSEILALVTAGIFAIIVAFFIPIANKFLFHYVVPDYNVSLLKQITLGLFLSAISIAIFKLARSYLTLRIEGIFQHRLQISLWDRLLKLPMSFFHKISTGDALQRTLIFDVIRRILSEGTLRIIFNGIFGVLFLFIMSIFSLRLTLIALFFSSLAFFLTILLLKFNLFRDQQIFETSGRLSSFLTQIVKGIDKIRLSAADWHVFSLWSREYDQFVRNILKSKKSQNRTIVINTFLENIATVFIFGAVIWMMPISEKDHGYTMSIGTFMGFFSAYFLFNHAIFDALNALSNCVYLIPFWKKTESLFLSTPEITSEKSDTGIIKGDIHVENLTFHYPGNSAIILDELNFEIKAGEFVGISGPSGVGKSTLIRLLINFETPTNGSIFYDNKDLNNLNTIQLRKQMGIVLQNSSIFSGTIFQNITTEATISTQMLDNALKWSTLAQDIEKLPMGLDTILPSGGNNLSKGQIQKILLARAFIKDPKILILDEALHILDQNSLETVLKHIKELNITRIMVTQKQDLLKQAERTIHIENGMINR